MSRNKKRQEKKDGTAVLVDSANELKFIDLFCGIGGFHIAAQIACDERGVEPVCVFSSEIDPDAQDAYEANFKARPHGDITKIHERDIPDHDILFAGFPCQAFSICGDQRGFEDTRGTLFFDVARILKEKRPRAFVLENVKQLRSHNQGRTLYRIMETLRNLGYHADYRILNALDFGLPQKRERIFIVGFREPRNHKWPTGGMPMKPLSEVLEIDVPEFYYASEKIRRNRLESVSAKKKKPGDLTIWHENKGGNISPLPYSCALRAGASYNYLLVNGERRLTEREMLRLQGFPNSYEIVCGYQATRKQAGNSVAVPCVAAVIRSVLDALNSKPIYQARIESADYAVQEPLFA
ncbi:MAG: DNA (cytosine-5-)-methyltransferase [Pyrinomonadaceae bacterium]|nr:DNA (cytosine-5-)-methyltransferase [Pyrinomonadaceae bacterium]